MNHFPPVNPWREPRSLPVGRRIGWFTGTCFLLCLPLLALGCRQDMYNQPKLKPLAPTEFFNGGTSARPLPAHVVARGELDEDTVLHTGKNPDGTLSAEFPVPVTRELLARGRERYNIYCSVCHGATGQGNGMIVQRGFPPPNSYHEPRLRQAPPGYFFDVITNGYGVMYPYGYRVPEARDRWAIVAYIRALQLARDGRLDDVPPGDHARLDAVEKP